MASRSRTGLLATIILIIPLVLAVARSTHERDLLDGGFVRSPANPLTGVRTCDPWDGVPIPGAVHPSVLYFPDGMDGFKFWMVYTPYTAPYPERD